MGLLAGWRMMKLRGMMVGKPWSSSPRYNLCDPWETSSPLFAPCRGLSILVIHNRTYFSFVLDF